MALKLDTWTSLDGSEKKVVEMDTIHLINAIRAVERNDPRYGVKHGAALPAMLAERKRRADSGNDPAAYRAQYPEQFVSSFFAPPYRLPENVDWKREPVPTPIPERVERLEGRADASKRDFRACSDRLRLLEKDYEALISRVRDAEVENANLFEHSGRVFELRRSTRRSNRRSVEADGPAPRKAKKSKARK